MVFVRENIDLKKKFYKSFRDQEDTIQQFPLLLKMCEKVLRKSLSDQRIPKEQKEYTMGC